MFWWDRDACPGENLPSIFRNTEKSNIEIVCIRQVISLPAIATLSIQIKLTLPGGQEDISVSLWWLQLARVNFMWSCLLIIIIFCNCVGFIASCEFANYTSVGFELLNRFAQTSKVCIVSQAMKVADWPGNGRPRSALFVIVDVGHWEMREYKQKLREKIHQLPCLGLLYVWGPAIWHEENGQIGLRMGIWDWRGEEEGRWLEKVESGGYKMFLIVLLIVEMLGVASAGQISESKVCSSIRKITKI